MGKPFKNIFLQADDSSCANEALQLIFSDSLDNKSLMFDLSKLLNEENNLSTLTSVNPTRINLTTSNVQPMLIPKRSVNNSMSSDMQLDMDETFSAPQTTPSSSVGAFGNNSSYGTSPLQA